MTYNANDLVKALERARKAGLRPVKLVLDGREIEDTPMGEVDKNPDARFMAEQAFFGVRVAIEDGFAVVVDGYLSVWNDREG